MAVNTIASDLTSAVSVPSAFASSASSAVSVRRAVAGTPVDEAMRAIASDNLSALTGTGQELVAKARTLDMEIGAGPGVYSGPRRPATRNMRMVSTLFTGTV